MGRKSRYLGYAEALRGLQNREIFEFDSVDDLIWFLNTCGEDVRIRIHLERGEGRAVHGTEKDR